MIRLLLFNIVLCLSFQGAAQTAFYTDFDEDMDKYYPKTEKDEAVYGIELLQPQWVEGISGRALDLSENAALRKPLVLDSLGVPKYGKIDDLSVQIWVKTLNGAHQGTPVVGNMLDEDTKGPGWKIFTQPTGAWGVILSDGKKTYTYQPNAPRQAINDGKWHQIAFSINKEKGEVWFFLDGENVAIYNTEGLGSLENENRTVIGGSYEYFEWESSGHWTAFNGYIDEVSINNVFDNVETIKKNYSRFKSLPTDEILISPLRVMVWNIWHGGRRLGKHVGVQRIVETIKESQADVIGLIETYGSGEIIADSLGYHFYLISSNLSIMSRYPIKETIKAFHSFNFGGAILDVGNNRELVLLNTWLHYLPDYRSRVTKGETTSDKLVEAEKETRHSEIKSILKEIQPIISNYNNAPIIMLGDFNCGSHLDWIEETKNIHYNYVVEWPVSLEMEKAGFNDSFRELNTNPLLSQGLTWTPRAATSSVKYGVCDRIDYIYYKGKLNPIESKVIDYHPIMFPSDHAAVITVFEMD